jgi:hypothetical protein
MEEMNESLGLLGELSDDLRQDYIEDLIEADGKRHVCKYFWQEAHILNAKATDGVVWNLMVKINR